MSSASARTAPNRGFTLIEVLTVIAIIGILAAVVIAPLGGARDNARDKSAAADMQSILVEASLYRASTGSYSGVCAAVAALQTQIQDTTGTAPTCEEEASKFGIIVKLRGAGYYCVDSAKVYGNRVNAALVAKQCPTT